MGADCITSKMEVEIEGWLMGKIYFDVEGAENAEEALVYDGGINSVVLVVILLRSVAKPPQSEESLKSMLTRSQCYALGIPHFVRNDRLASCLRRNVLMTTHNSPKATCHLNNYLYTLFTFYS
jgi:hypothetical protein